MPWPWYESIKDTQGLYHEILKENLNFTEDSYHKLGRFVDWSEKIPKAALFGNWNDCRGILFDAGRRRPDIFDMSFSYKGCIEPWNPTSEEQCATYEQMKNAKNNFTDAEIVAFPAGYVSPLGNISNSRSYRAFKYKYVIVPLGSAAESTSGRLAHLLADSGAVILLQRTEFVYHFSALLKPWVHYVPLSYSAADVIDKVQWLLDHDDMARQIAANGRAFARSYLRMEDYYCYAAHAIEMLGNLQEGSNVTQPFYPQKYEGPASHHVQPLGPDFGTVN